MVVIPDTHSCSSFPRKRESICAYSLMDRAAASGAAGAGSNPARRVFLKIKFKEGKSCVNK